MRQALWIFRKDFTHMRPKVALVWLLMAGAAVADSAVGRDPQLANMAVIKLPVVLAQWFLVISVVHGDRLVGGRQFCVTRPYSWKSLLLAKGLFALLLFNLPVLLDRVVALVVNGLSPLDYLSDLLGEQLLLAVGMLFVIAFAALTANLVQVVVSILAAYLAVFTLSMSLARTGLQLMPLRGSAMPIDDAIRWATVALFAGLACWRQFARREHLRASCLLVAGWLAIFPFYSLIPWGVVFHVLERRSPPIDHSIFRVEADAAREASGGLIQGKADIVLPVSVTGIPDGMEAYSERIEIALRAPDGAAWNSGWDPYNVLHGDNSSTSAVYRLVPGKGGPYWLFAHVDESFLGVHGSEPLHVHATVAFTMLGRPQTKLVSRWGTPLAIAGNGVCEFSKFPSNVSGLCVTPLRKPALTVIRIQPLPSGSPNEAPALDRDPGGNANYGEFGIWRVWQQAWMTVPRGPFAMSVEVRQAVAHFERELDMPGVRLKEYR